MRGHELFPIAMYRYTFKLLKTQKITHFKQLIIVRNLPYQNSHSSAG